MEFRRNTGKKKTDDDSISCNDNNNICSDNPSDSVEKLIQKSKQGWKMFAYIICIFLAIVCIQSFLFSATTVVGHSMDPTLENSQLILVRKFNVNPERYDIVIAKAQNQRVVKRVIGLPGDYLELADGSIYINGEKIDDDYDFYTEYAGVLNGGYTVGDDKYFIVGDNRQNSYDSRYYGAVDINELKGIKIGGKENGTEI